MKRKLEEKILAEIRRIVIEKDLKRQTEQEKDEMREANIEALTDLTSLSREEVEKISGDVRKVFIHQLKKSGKEIFVLQELYWCWLLLHSLSLNQKRNLSLPLLPMTFLKIQTTGAFFRVLNTSAI
jgi:hypothetical protein